MVMNSCSIEFIGANVKLNLIKMKKIIIPCLFVISCLLIPFKLFPENLFFPEISTPDSLPLVLPRNKADLVDSRLRNEAVSRFATHQLPANLNEWESYKNFLRSEIIK